MTQAVFGTGAGARAVSCVYDGFGRLKKVNDNGKETEYTYDADGYRIRKSVGEHTEDYIYDNGQLVLTVVPAATSVYTGTIPASGYGSTTFGMAVGEQYFVEINGTMYSGTVRLDFGTAEAIMPYVTFGDGPDDGRPEEPEDPSGPNDPPAGFGTFVILEAGDVTIVSPDGGVSGTISGPAGAQVKVYTGDPRKTTTSYIRGLGLIASRAGSTPTYYHYDAHGNVIQTTDANGNLVKNYYYDAFGVEQNADSADTNPFRYCGEQYDTETGNYYLRARYYTPGVGRFTQEDTHWNPKNMIYGDNPQKWNEYQSWVKNEADKDDPLGLHTYTYKPEATAVAQAGNLYGYGVNNPVAYYDPSGELAWPGEIHNQVVDHIAKQYQYYSEEIIYYDVGWGRADLISPTGRVWEVKPNKARHISKGKEQLKKYVQNKWKRNPNMKLSTGEYIEPDSFWYTNASGTTTYFISYYYAGEGVIVYDYTESTNWDRVGEISWSLLAALGSAALIVASGGSYVPAY